MFKKIFGRQPRGTTIFTSYEALTKVEHIVTKRGKVTSHRWDVIPNDLPDDEKDARALRVIRGEIE